MERTINAIKTLKETLEARNAEIITEISEIEDRLAETEEETEEYEALCKRWSRLDKEKWANEKLLPHLGICDYCKASDKNLCDFCY